ncbi:MAG: carbon storage regulator CsrA [Anaerolineales bacterium]|nr:carbon storage regulator CsrA [Anaerolineales bacterium]
MLVLTRKIGDGLLIGDGITVTILSVEGDRVKVGIDAPREIRVLRRELADAVKAQNLAAARNTAADLNSLTTLKKLLVPVVNGDTSDGQAPPTGTSDS